MGCFFACFRIKNCDRQKIHLVSKSTASKNRDPLVTKNQLASVFQCEEKGLPGEPVRHLSLQENFDRESDDQELEDEVKFLKSCGTVLKTPEEIKKVSKNGMDQIPDDDWSLADFHSRLPDSFCKKLHWDDQPDQLSDTATEVQETSCMLESKSESCCYEEYSTQSRTLRIDEGIEHISGNELADSINLYISTEDQIQQIGSNSSACSTLLSLSKDILTTGTVYTSKATENNNRIQTQDVDHVLNLVQNSSQLKELREGAVLGPSSDEFEQQTSSSIQHGDRSKQTSHTLELSPCDNKGQNQHTIFKQEVDFNQETPKLIVSSLSQWLKPPVSNEERWKAKILATERSPSSKSPDADRPIIGMVAAHWNKDEPNHASPKWFDGNGIPNSTNKYKEDQKVSWHAMPFEERLEKALTDEKLFPRRELKLVNLEESEESDTAASQPRLQ